jgi:hypothetical protein
MPEQNFSEQLWSGLADAVADIREKVVEEPMWGRAVTERGEAPQWPEAREAEPSVGSSTHTREMEPEREQAQDIDLDR